MPAGQVPTRARRLHDQAWPTELGLWRLRLNPALSRGADGPRPNPSQLNLRDRAEAQAKR